MIDLEKRKRIMQRSMKLGHCICNPKQACPCDPFKQRDVCLCAGERLEDTTEEVRLTRLVESAGCASKINQNDLKKVLAALPQISDPRVLVGANACDDAGVYQLEDGATLVQSVDVFTPNVDDPYTFGQIAAANSLSDIYAMGGRPLTALSIIGFPIETFSHKVMIQTLRGGMDKMQEAGVAVIGGHSINDRNMKFGFAVTGIINPSGIITNGKAQPGDALILTKPIGTGIVSFANQLGKASSSAMTAISRSMAGLNKVASELMVNMGVNAATDVTGFGLLGHLSEMVSQSGVTVEIYADQVPVFDEVLDWIAQGIIPGAVERNKEYASRYVSLAEDVSEETEYVLNDPQTSGGLLIAVPEEKAGSLVERLKESGIEHASVIGKVVSNSEGRILLKMNRGSKTPKIDAPKEKVEAQVPAISCCEPDAHMKCCASLPDVGIKGTAANVREKFSDFIGVVNSEGAIPLRNKELIAIALSLLSKCEPCVNIHIDKARALGVSEDEIGEATWLAVSFGGAPILMFYNSIKGKE